MISDAALCGLVADSYQAVPTIQVSDVRLVLTLTHDCLIVAIPGTREKVIADWVRDMACIPHSDRQHPRLGRCHDGCLSGAEAVLEPLQAAVGAMPYVIAAHSLGGGIGVLLAALMVLWGSPPENLVTFGCMRSSIGRDIADILSDVPGRHYHHGADPVPCLPGWPYSVWRMRTQLGAAGIMPRVSDHMIAAYRSSLSA